jgi:hypothetical protein
MSTARYLWAHYLYRPVLDNCPLGERGFRQQLKAGIKPYIILQRLAVESVGWQNTSANAETL